MLNTRSGRAHSPISKKLIALRLIILACAVVSLFWLLAIPVLAVINQPSGNCTISNFHANRNLVQTNDLLIYASYDIPYTSIPSVTADQSFLFRLMDPTDTIEIAAIAPFAFYEFDSGYNEGTVAFYFDNVTAPTWGLSYYIRISENPSQFASPLSWDFLIPTTAYSSLTSQTSNQLDLASKVISISSTLQSAFGHTMTQASSGGMVLSADYGEPYWRGAIYGIQAMAPTLFLIQLAQLDLTSTNWTTAQFDTYQHQFDPTWVGPAENATASQFGLTPPGFMSIVVLLPCLAVCIASSLKYHRIEPGLVASSVFLLMGVLMGWFPISLFAGLNQIEGLYVSFVWFYARG